MRRAKHNHQVPKRYYRPEQTTCPDCECVLKRCHSVWRKYITFLDGRYWVVNMGYRCSNSYCKNKQVYTSQAAQHLTVRGSSFALEVIAQIGYWRFWRQWTVARIHEELTQARHLLISERQVLYLIGVFLVLLRCTYSRRLKEHAAYFRRHGIFLAIDALKPEKGNTALYVARDLKFGLVLHEVSLLGTDHRTLATRLLQPVKRLGYRIRGIVSDDEPALLMAVAQVFPGVSHQTCQFHCLRDAAIPIVNADQTLKKSLKKAIRGPFYAACRALNQQLGSEDPRYPVLGTYAELIRSTLTEGGKPPFVLGGLRVFEDLTRLEASLKRSGKKGGHPLLDQFLAVAQRRRRFTAQYRQLKRQRDWLVELERRLDPTGVVGQPRPTARQVKRKIEEFLARLEQHAQGCPADAPVVAHICATFRQRWPRLFACYGWPEPYRTNNDLETFFGRLRTRQRRINGRKAVHEFIIRYGEWAVFIDPTETLEQLLQRFEQFDQAEFDREYARFEQSQQRLRILYRFRHHPRRCLKELEQRWAEAISHES